jgi:hypothetical protein
MKKLFLSLALASAVAFANAQDMTSKKGVPILPESGDWSISFDAVPFLNYIGNAFNGTSNNSVFAGWADTSNFTIVGKWVRDNNMAYRGKVRIGFGSMSSDNIHATANPSAPANTTVTDETSVSNMNITLSGGIQKWRGKGRVQGYYGAELGFTIGSGPDTSYTYGDPLDASWNPGPRTKEINAGSTFGINLRGFIGVEYFLAPKMSIAAEYGWGIAFSSTGEGEVTGEGLPTPPATQKTGGSSRFGIDTDNSGGSILLAFYF